MSKSAGLLHTDLAHALSARELRETHGSWVLLTETRAYKLKKPVRFGFVDLTTPTARRRACEEEVRVNRELAGDVVLGVRAVLRDGVGWALGAPDDPTAVDWVVEMRRYDEDHTMAELAARGQLTENDVASVGRRIAYFHAATRRVVRPNFGDCVAAAWSRNFDELRPLAGTARDAPLDALARFADAFTNARLPELDARGAAGLVREGHGDLRADHVLLDSGVTIVDRLEFDVALREVDVSDDLAFLLMDLEARGAGWAADALVDAYRAAGGEPGDDGLLAFFSAYRALVRAKVALLRAEQLPPGTSSGSSRNSADALIQLAEDLAWRARAPVTVVVCGPPASGKSTLAEALAPRMRASLLSSDAVRKELLGVPEDRSAPAAAYSHGHREGVYAELGRRVSELTAEQATVVDATFGDRSLRARFSDSLDVARRSALRWVECSAPIATLVERAASRSPQASHGSDAGPAVAARLARDFEPLDEIPTRRHLAVDGRDTVAATLRSIGEWLDAELRQDVVDAAARRGLARGAVSEAQTDLGRT